ncbi:calpain-11-like [Schistocerca gregaria]|uniref:calpain-11-like n=1 Tax=Schistocerca gregaria TaxID=7010 RepID=UPI00211EE9DD|nr:calpain-11-like [Schistocerca gregaria]
MLPAQGDVKPFKENQIYEELQEQCLKNGCNFEDPEFPACASSLAVATRGLNIEWKRPKDITNGAVFFMDASPSDVIQGDLDDCWFLAPAAFLTQKPDLFSFVVPSNQDIESGILHFRFWQEDEGLWVDVVIDDRLPAQQDEITGNWNLIYARPGQDQQYWCPLLEKAFAKLNESYNNLNGANVSEGLQCLTSYKCQEVEIYEDNLNEILNVITEGGKNGSFMGFNVKHTSPEFRRRHIYTIGEVYHDDSDGTCWLKIQGASDSFAGSIGLDTRTPPSELSAENELWLPVDEFCGIGEILFVSHS